MTSTRYREVAAEIRDRIALGELGDPGALESEAALCERHGVSRATVRRALVELRNQGLIESRQGAGWFVSGSSFHQRLAVGTFSHAPSAVADAGGQVRRSVVGFGYVPPPAAVATTLDLAAGGEALQCLSVRSVDGTPLDVVTEWVTDDAAGALSRDDAAHPGIWQALERHGYRVGTVRQTIASGVASPADAALLEVEPGAPLLLVRRLAVRTDGRPLALADHRYLGHRFTLEVEFRGWRSAGATEPPGITPHPPTERSDP